MQGLEWPFDDGSALSIDMLNIAFWSLHDFLALEVLLGSLQIDAQYVRMSKS